MTFRGTGGHGGAGAHLATDATLALAHFILAVQTIVSRNVAATETCVISVGSIAGGDAGSPNIIPSEVTVTGTARSYKPQIRDLMERRLTEIAQVPGRGVWLHCRCRLQPALPAADYPCRADRHLRSPPHRPWWVRTRSPPMFRPYTGSEDFSFMLEARPGSFIMIGNGVDKDGKTHHVHTPGYDFNDDILALGVAYWIKLVGTELGAS